MRTTRAQWISTAIALLAVGSASYAGTIHFSGHTWAVRAAGKGGPGPNEWDPGNVWVDEKGYLHLKLTQRDGKWHCSEVSTQDRLGFGRYEFQVVGRLDQFDRNIVLGLFNYPTSDVGPDGTHEIDIEFARWGKASAPVGNYTVWPATTKVRRESRAFAFTLNGDSSTHHFTWSSTNVVFQSWHGNGEGKADTFASWIYPPSTPTNWIAQKPMPVHLNLWCFQGQPPSDGKEVEIIVRAFKFTPL